MVHGIEPMDSEEAEHRSDVLAWIDAGSPLFRTAKPATPPKHLVSYCVLADTDSERIFLVDHRDAERWLPTGGHVEPDEHPADAAAREMSEELGIRPDFLAPVGPYPLLVTVTQTTGRSVPHTDVSLWFAFDLPTVGRIHPDATEFVGSRWWDLDVVRHGDGTRFDPHLPRFVAKLRAATRKSM